MGNKTIHVMVATYTVSFITKLYIYTCQLLAMYWLNHSHKLTQFMGMVEPVVPSLLKASLVSQATPFAD